jgi:hypothetical protein
MEEFKGDKRTKAYKEWKAKFEKQQESKSKGLGDTVEKFTEATGIKKVVKAVAGEDCGCSERKATLNKLFSYKTVECLTEDEYRILDAFFTRTNQSRVDYITQKNLIAIYSRVFGKKQDTTNCSSCLRSIVNQLRKVYENN